MEEVTAEKVEEATTVEVTVEGLAVEGSAKSRCRMGRSTWSSKTRTPRIDLRPNLISNSTSHHHLKLEGSYHCRPELFHCSP